MLIEHVLFVSTMLALSKSVTSTSFLIQLVHDLDDVVVPTD